MDTSTVRPTDLGSVKPNYAKNSAHIPSKIQADTLFTFTTELRFLIENLRNAMLSPRYCSENISFLKLGSLKEIAYPMKCFCDINLHRLHEHLGWYGYYGLAFSKEWGMQRGIQPVQYINPKSELVKSFSKAFKASLKDDPGGESSNRKAMTSFIFHEMVYYKPYEGKMINRLNGKLAKKCFTDECEWRFVPDVSVTDFKQAYVEQDIIASGLLKEFSNAMAGDDRISLKFDYSDIKYIIVKSKEDFSSLAETILKLPTDAQTQYEMISKAIIWDNSKGDF